MTSKSSGPADAGPMRPRLSTVPRRPQEGCLCRRDLIERDE